MSGYIDDDRTDLVAPLEILDVDIVAGPTVLDAEDAVSAVSNRVRTQETRGAVTFTEDHLVLGPRGAEGVMADARPDLSRAVCVVKALSFLIEVDRGVQGSRKPIRQVGQGFQVQESDFDFVRPTVPDRIHHGVAVRGEAHDREQRSIGGVDVGGVEYDFVFTVQLGLGVFLFGVLLLWDRTTIDHRSLLTLAPHGEVLMEGLPIL